jgi:L-cysteine:1D-myo-inositol 2-amino-2-deoxy-alpha-D-glucopyranoside ligase
MHTALIAKDGEKMSKSLGNLVFVDALRRDWDPMAIRLGIIGHHYGTEWEWDDDLMARSLARLERWRAASVDPSADGGALDAVREALDDDLDTPAALAAIDDAAAAGQDVTAAAALLGITL